MVVTADFVKSCIYDYHHIVMQHRKSRQHLLQQLLDLKEEEESLIMPGKVNEPNSFGFSSVQTYSDTTYNAVSSISRANIESRVKSIQKQLEQLQEKSEIVERTLYLFHSMALYFPLHASVVNDYLYEKKILNQTQLQKSYSMGHDALREMIKNLCDAIAELVSKEIYELKNDDDLFDNLSKEVIEQLKRCEYRRKGK